MLGAMRDFWAEGTPEAKREAAIIARHAAPYVHPRLASIDQTIHEPHPYVIVVPEELSVEEWTAKYCPTAQAPVDSLSVNTKKKRSDG
jgi:hypothetical protein